MAFKSESSFLAKISMGAVGTRRVLEDLQSSGHDGVELERGSTNNKIWREVKIKRVRMPDILCVSCGTRVECRAKTAESLAIAMSHSLADEDRAWDFGLQDEDYVALVACRLARSDDPTSWKPIGPVQYLRVGDLRETFGLAKLTAMKGAEEGSERTVKWPACVSQHEARVTRVDRVTGQIYMTTDDGRNTHKRFKLADGTLMKLAVRVGEHVNVGQILASVVPVHRSLACDGHMIPGDYVAMLESPMLSAQYAAAKAMGNLVTLEADELAPLRAVAESEDRHIYVRLEAAASLCRHEVEAGWKTTGSILETGTNEHQLEVALILGEVGGGKAVELLSGMLADDCGHREVRVGAAYSLGRTMSAAAIYPLVEALADDEALVREEAARALSGLADDNRAQLVEMLVAGPPERRPGIAWALAAGAKLDPGLYPSGITDPDTITWLAFAAAYGRPRMLPEVREALVRSCGPRGAEAAESIQLLSSSWVIGMDGL